MKERVLRCDYDMSERPERTKKTEWDEEAICFKKEAPTEPEMLNGKEVRVECKIG